MNKYQLRRIYEIQDKGYFVRILNLSDHRWACGVRTEIDKNTIAYGSAFSIDDAIRKALSQFDIYEMNQKFEGKPIKRKICGKNGYECRKSACKSCQIIDF